MTEASDQIWAEAVLRGADEVRIVGPSAESREDLIQEAILRLWQGRSASVRGASGPGRFLRTVVRNLTIDAWRKARPERLHGEPGARASTPLDASQVVELRAALETAIAALPGEQREVVRMRFFEGVTFKEIARIQGVPLNTALGRMHLAMKKLRTRLEDGGFTPDA